MAQKQEIKIGGFYTSDVNEPIYNIIEVIDIDSNMVAYVYVYFERFCKMHIEHFRKKFVLHTDKPTPPTLTNCPRCNTGYPNYCARFSCPCS